MAAEAEAAREARAKVSALEKEKKKIGNGRKSSAAGRAYHYLCSLLFIRFLLLLLFFLGYRRRGRAEGLKSSEGSSRCYSGESSSPAGKEEEKKKLWPGFNGKTYFLLLAHSWP